MKTCDNRRVEITALRSVINTYNANPLRSHTILTTGTERGEDGQVLPYFIPNRAEGQLPAQLPPPDAQLPPQQAAIPPPPPVPQQMPQLPQTPPQMGPVLLPVYASTPLSNAALPAQNSPTEIFSPIAGNSIAAPVNPLYSPITPEPSVYPDTANEPETTNGTSLPPVNYGQHLPVFTLFDDVLCFGGDLGSGSGRKNNPVRENTPEQSKLPVSPPCIETQNTDNIDSSLSSGDTSRSDDSGNSELAASDEFDPLDDEKLQNIRLATQTFNGRRKANCYTRSNKGPSSFGPIWPRK